MHKALIFSAYWKEDANNEGPGHAQPWQYLPWFPIQIDITRGDPRTPPAALAVDFDQGQIWRWPNKHIRDGIFEVALGDDSSKHLGSFVGAFCRLPFTPLFDPRNSSR